jgi:hypothetical protein
VYFTLFNWYECQKNIQIQLNLAKKLKIDKNSKNN